MATKSVKKTYTTKELKGITKRQANILRLRKKLNTPDPNAVKPFTKYKNITYLFVVLFPPYALYRIWCKNSTFKTQEKIVQSGVTVMFLYIIITQLIRL